MAAAAGRRRHPIPPEQIAKAAAPAGGVVGDPAAGMASTPDVWDHTTLLATVALSAVRRTSGCFVAATGGLPGFWPTFRDRVMCREDRGRHVARRTRLRIL